MQFELFAFIYVIVSDAGKTAAALHLTLLSPYLGRAYYSRNSYLIRSGKLFHSLLYLLYLEYIYIYIYIYISFLFWTGITKKDSELLTYTPNWK